jgi:hypothetical protein
MFDRRIEMRILCADLVDLQWRDKGGRLRRAIANLEDISGAGACLQVDRPVPLGTELKMTYPKGELAGKVKYCVFREIGYFLGVEFEEGVRWKQQDFRPQHMLDPRRLVQKAQAAGATVAPPVRKGPSSTV